MSDYPDLRATFRDDPTPSKRQIRAARTVAEAVSIRRILWKILMTPLVALGIAMTIYVWTSPYERTDALRHLVALSGCEAAQGIGLSPAFAGELGYHAKNDPDGDGVACDTPEIAAVHVAPAAPASETPLRGARFLSPNDG